ncbi:MAG: hypothetical protein EXR36_12465 [Betaproteobacteria bacterium]|nr:hypothetical protein [Betaproteobacteria bacterium]
MQFPFTNMSLPAQRGLFGLLQEIGQTLATFIIAGLMFFGIVAFIFTTMGPNGWLKAFLSELLTQHPMAAMTAVSALVIFGATGKRYVDHTTFHVRIGNGLTYACLSCGIYFAAKLATTGAI